MSGSKLALLGGPPVRSELLPYGRQAINQDDLEAVVRVLQGDWLTQGPTIGDFEEAFAAVHGAKHAVAFANGTAALHGACFAAGLGPGDEALVPAMTFAATANAVVYVGGEPVFVDVDPATGLLDPEQLTRAITGRTRAILPMHYAGLPVDMDAIRTVARAHGLKIIADACHAAGAVYRGEKAGVLGDLACFSFHPVKHLTTGEGGMVLTDDPDEAARLRAFRSHGIYRPQPDDREVGGWHYEMRELGYNYRLTDFQAALGLSQLRRLPEFIARRRAHAAAYDEAFAGEPLLGRLTEGSDRLCVYHLYPLLFDMAGLTCDKRTLFAALRAEGLGVQVHYIPVPRHPFYRKRGVDPAATPGAEAFFEKEISIPLFVEMTEQDRLDTVAAVRKVLHFYRRKDRS